MSLLCLLGIHDYAAPERYSYSRHALKILDPNFCRRCGSRPGSREGRE